MAKSGECQDKETREKGGKEAKRRANREEKAFRDEKGILMITNKEMEHTQKEEEEAREDILSKEEDQEWGKSLRWWKR